MIKKDIYELFIYRFILINIVSLILTEKKSLFNDPKFIIIIIYYTNLLRQTPTIMIDITPTPTQKVYACFFPTNISEETVQNMFSAFGTITLFRLFKRKDGFTYSYITYETIEEAHRAIKYMNKTKIEDKILKVSFAVANCEPKKKKSYFKKENKNNMQDLKEFPKIGDKKRKKEMKLQKKQTKLTKQSQQLEYLKRIEQTVKGLIQENEAYKAKQQQKKKQDLETSIESLNIFRSWLKQRKKFEAQQTEKEWSEQFNPQDLKIKNNDNN